MKKIFVKLGVAPNGIKTWGFSYDSNLVHDKTCATHVEKTYLDSIISATSNNEEYWHEVVKYACTMLEEKLINKNDIYNFEFICNSISYSKTKL